MANTHSLDLEASSSQYASISDALQTGLNVQDFTVEAWVKLEQLPSTATQHFTIISKYDFTNADREWLVQFRSDDTIRAYYSNDGSATTFIASTSAMVSASDVGQWVHIAVSVDVSAKTGQFYKNGVAVTTNAGSGTAISVSNGSSPVVIGANDEGRADFFDGLIDEVRVWDDIRTATEILDNKFFDLIGNEANLQGYWKLDNDYLDTTSNNNDLTASGSPIFSTDIPSSTKASLDLEASSSQYASIVDASQTGLDVTGDFTIEAWIKPESLTDFQVIVSKDNVSVSRSYSFHTMADGSINAFVFGTGGSTQIQSQSNASLITTGVWYHVAMAVDVTADTIDLYINGSEVAYSTDSTGTITSVTDSTAPFSVGSRQTSSTNELFFDGLVDEVRFWNDKRTATEISDNRFSQLVGNEANLQGYWKLDNDYLDTTSNNNDLTASGSPVFSTDIHPVELLDKLIAYYSLNDATDVHSTFDLTNTGAVPFNAGKIDNGADFTPNDSLNNNSVLASTAYPRSFAGWSKFDTISDQAIFAIGDGSIHYYALRVRKVDGGTDEHIVFRSNNNTEAADVDTGITAVAGTWYHWVVIQNSATSVTIYINNTETNTAATTFSATVDQFFLGYLGRSSVWYMDGITDEVGIWNKALTSNEVTRLYNSGNGLAYPFPENASPSSTISETVTTTETVTVLRERVTTISETVSTSETVTANKGVIAVILDTITTSEAVTSLRELVSSVIDTILTSEPVVTFISLIRNTSKNSGTNITNQDKNSGTNITNQDKNSGTNITNKNKS